MRTKIALLGVAALMISAILSSTALAVSPIWWFDSSTDKLWSNVNNWNLTASNGLPQTTGSPVGNDVIFDNTGSAVAPYPVTNEVDNSYYGPINSLWYSQLDPNPSWNPTPPNPPSLAIPAINVHKTQIDAGVILTINGSAAAPYTGMNGPYALFAGVNAPLATYTNGNNSVSLTYIVGADSSSQMSIQSWTGDSATSGDIDVGQSIGGNDAQGNAIAILDMSDLANFTANVDQVLIGYSKSTVSGDPARRSGALYLAQNNTITMNNPGTLANAGLIVGYAGRNGAKYNFLYLGQTNVLNVNNVIIAGKRGSQGWMMFNTAKWASSQLKMRGKDGSSPVSSIILGENSETPSGSASDAYGLMDLRGGTADIIVDQLILGRVPTTGSSGTARGGQGTLYLAGGTIDATTIILGDQLSDWNSSGSTHATTGTINVSGGTLKVGTTFTLAYRSTIGGINGQVAGTLNITGGTVQSGCDILDGGDAPVSPATATSTILLNGGTLDMGVGGLHAIGGAGTAAIDSLTFSSGTLKNVSQINGGANISKTGAGTLIIDGINTYSGGTTVAQGTLLADGSLTSIVTVNSSAILGGKGSIGGLNVQAGGTVSPGDSPGQLTIAGSVSLGGILAEEILGNVAGTGYDQLVVNDGSTVSNVTIGGTLAVTDTYTPNATDVFWIINDTSATGTLTGTFGTITGLPAGFDVFYNVDFATNSLAPNSGNDVAIALLVPEPSALLMLIMAAGLGLLFKRFRR